MAKSDVRAEASLDDETIARVEAEAAERGKADFTLEAVVTDADGQTVATYPRPLSATCAQELTVLRRAASEP
jgi:hypothetical protein